MAKPRILPDFLSAWETYTAPLHAAEPFKKWSGLAVLSAILTRKVWIRTSPVMPPLYPNLFILLSGAPGSGKDLVINTTRDLLTAALDGMEQGKGICIGPESISTKGLIDSLADEASELVFTYREGKTATSVKYHSLYIANGELGAFMPEYNTQMVSVINDLYNCKASFTDRVRGRGTSSLVKIENPHLTMLLGTQPALFARIVPEEAFQMGFTARLNIVNSPHEVRKPLFGNSHEIDANLFGKLASDLRVLADHAGQYKTTPQFEAALNTFHVENPGALTHSRFTDYNIRRSLHVCKLSMCCAASESNELILTEAHFNRALKYLQISESSAPSLFDNLITSSGFHHTVEQALHNTGEQITQAQLERKLRRTHKPHEVGQIIRSMIASEDIKFLHYTGGMPVYSISNDIEAKLQ